MPYIDRDALIERLTRMWESRQLTNTKYKSFTEILTAESTADVVKVVRCKDCKYWMDIDNGRQKHEMCAQLMPKWYCADGKRKETEDGNN